MDRLEYTVNYIMNYKNPKFDFSDKSDILSGLIASLSEEELYELFFSNISAPRLNKKIIKRICNDLKYGNARHNNIISRSIAELKQNIGKKDANAQLLQGIFEYLSHSKLEQLILILISDKSKKIRNRGYNLLDDKIAKKNMPILKKNWEKYHDNEASLNLILYSDDTYFISNYESFLKFSKEIETECYTRLITLFPDKIKDIKKSNSFLYLYLAAILKIEIPSHEVKGILLSNTDNIRFPLLLWCVGKMGNWETLRDYYEQK